ncbi:hypothetical protein ACIQVC_28745 [Streptomyces sp. NPDC101112]|uniref:hypothetical protein n=1 Tax=Streptomyces sp. NPDC101112 TaxID=3366105 RepID=UPI00381ECDDF
MQAGISLRAVRTTLARVTTLALLAGLAGVGCSEENREAAREFLRDRYRLTIMTLNIAGALPGFSSTPEISLPWRERYQRIANGFKDGAVSPDIIALQEATARKEWTLSRDPEDYESLHYLIEQLSISVGRKYRIAYLGAFPSNHPGLIQGQAVLYDPARLKNATKAPTGSMQPGDQRPALLGVHPRKSYPCDSPAEAYKDQCGLLDGEGVFWTAAFENKGKKKEFQTGHVRFAFAEEEQSQFNFYNIHLTTAGVDSSESEKQAAERAAEAAVALINYIEGRAYEQKPIYPPLLAGDFNGGTERFPHFDRLADWNIDFILGGDPAFYEASQKHVDPKQSVLPGEAPNPDGMCAPREVAWSDHCAVSVEVTPV